MSLEKFRESVYSGDILGALIAYQSIGNLNMEYKELHNSSPLMYTAHCGMAAVIDVLLDAGAAVNFQGTGGTALHYATSRNFAECAQILRKQGAKINIRDASGYTALMYACQNRNIDLVKYLIEAYPEPADVNSLSSALRLASLNDSLEIVNLLLEAGACASIKSVHGETSLDIARKMENKHVIELLSTY